MDKKVLDEAVAMACDELAAVGILVMKNEMRAALLAGVKVLLGEPVAYADPLSFQNFKVSGHLGGAYSREWMWAKPGENLVPVYAPSLGEGDGR